MYGYIYKTTNNVNGKIYIGQHKSTEFDQNYYGSGKIIKLAIEKYGIENFCVDVLTYCNSKSELNSMERQLIKQYKSNDPNIGYNISSGGDGGDTFTGLSELEKEERREKLRKNSHFGNLTQEQSDELHRKSWETRRKNGTDKFTEDAIEKMRLSHIGKKPSQSQIRKMLATKMANGGYKHSEETKRKISESNKGKKHNLSELGRKRISETMSSRTGELNHFYGKHHTAETRRLISEKCGDNAKNTKWMNNGEKSIRVKEEDIKNYIELGYKLGRKRWKNG